MGLTQSTHDQASEGQDVLDAANGEPEPSRPTSPPHPSRSPLNPTSSRRSAFSYFLPISHRDLQHSHLNPTLDDVRKTAELLSARLPAELVLRVLDEARYWAGCRTLIQKDLMVVAGHTSPRNLPQPRTWRNGQETQVGLPEDEDGNVWYLASEPVGCDETRLSGSRAGGGGCWVRGLVIETLSKDQGWSSAVQADRSLYGESLSRVFPRMTERDKGTYEQSYSWFEVALVRNGKEVENSRRSFQNNIHGQPHLYDPSPHQADQSSGAVPQTPSKCLRAQRCHCARGQRGGQSGHLGQGAVSGESGLLHSLQSLCLLDDYASARQN